MQHTDAVRNEDGWWINSNVFREEALHFKKYGYYCPHKWGSSSWYDYWSEQLSRCKYGYRSGGAHITGDHYFYLNFTRIKLVQELTGSNLDRVKSMDKVTDFPSFWDGDYNYFHNVRLARYGAKTGYGIDPEEIQKLQLEFYPQQLDGGYHLCVGKARRKGFSYKNAALVTNRYNTIPDSINIVGAFDKKYLYPEGTMAMCNNYLNWLDTHTGWAKSRDFINRIDHKKASYKEKDDRGIEVEKGYLSQIMALTFGDNPDAARGKDGTLILFEEAGKWPNLLASIDATLSALKAGVYTTGQIIVFGTSGDMDSDSIPFSELFYEAGSRGFVTYDNIWDDDVYGSSCSFFFPDQQNKEGFIDEQGNSYTEEARKFEEKERLDVLQQSNSNNAHNQKLQEHPFMPKEAFLISSTSGFPTKELRRQYDRVRAEKLDKLGVPFLLSWSDGGVYGEPDLAGTTTPIYDYPMKSSLNREGAVVVWEPPVERPPWGLYKIGYDPYQQDKGTSLGAAYVYKGNLKYSYRIDSIVAGTVGRANTTDDFHERVAKLALWYNAEVMHENMTKDVFTYFRNNKKLKYLEKQPDEVIKGIIKKTKVDRGYGIHMNETIRATAETYLVKWLLTVRDHDVEGKQVLNLETIYDPALLKELSMYNRKGNFDRVDALLLLMLSLEQNMLTKEFAPEEEQEPDVLDQLNEMLMRRVKRPTP